MPQNITKIALRSGQTRTITIVTVFCSNKNPHLSVTLPHVHKYQEI